MVRTAKSAPYLGNVGFYASLDSCTLADLVADNAALDRLLSLPAERTISLCGRPQGQDPGKVVAGL